MKAWNKALALLLALVMAFSFAVTALAADEADAEEETVAAFEVPEDAEGSIVILHSNDVHGAIEGYAKMAALKAMYEDAGAYVLVVDAGDYIQGTTYVSVSQGKTAIELMNMAGYEYAALGNHEFDYGYDNMVEIAEDAEFEILSSNTLYEGEPAFGTHTVKELGDVKIGIFGLETPETATKAHPAKIQGVTFLGAEDLYACAQAEVDALKAEGVDYIVCLGHLGVDEETKATANRSVDMLANVTGIDVVIDGHSHSTLEEIEAVIAEEDGTGNTVGDTYVTSTGTKFANIGVVTIKDGSITTELVPVEAITTEDEDIAARVAEIVAEIEEEFGATFASTEVLLNGERDPGNRTEETNLGNLITDAILWYATREEGIEVPAENIIAVTNGGGIRATIEAGDISKNDINTVLPFGNTVAFITIEGSALLEALEASTYSTPTAVGGFPQVSGIKFTIDTTKEFDQGELYPDTTYYAPNSINRVTIDSINGQDFDPEATYVVVTNDFTAAGGDTYYAFSIATVVDTGTPMDVAVMDYITEVLDGVVPAEKYGETEGRITIIKPAASIDTVTAADGTVYYRLRDVAYAAIGTENAFDVGWTQEAGVVITTGGAYEGPALDAGDGAAEAAAITVTVDGETCEIGVMVRGNNNYVSGDDLTALLGIDAAALAA